MAAPVVVDWLRALNVIARQYREQSCHGPRCRCLRRGSSTSRCQTGT
jgi:hypothetical protein